MTSCIVHNSPHSCNISISLTKYTSSSSVNVIGRPRILDDPRDIEADNVPVGIFVISHACLKLHSPLFILSIAFNSSPSLLVDTFHLRMHARTITFFFSYKLIRLNTDIYTQFRTMQSNGSYLLTDDIFPGLRQFAGRKLAESQLDVVKWLQRQSIV